MHRLLKLLMSQGLIEQRASTQRYRAGRELFRIATLITRQIDVEEIAGPILSAMRDACHETCYFALYLPASRRFVGTVVARSPHPLGYHFEPLMEQKVAWGAVGRCMLAYLPDEEVAKAVAEAGTSPAGTPPPSLKDMKAILKEIRERGYASAEGEIFPGSDRLRPRRVRCRRQCHGFARHHHADDPLSSGDAQATGEPGHRQGQGTEQGARLSRAGGSSPAADVRPQRRAR